MANVHCFFMYGQGGKVVDQILARDGLGILANMVESLGVPVNLYNWAPGAYEVIAKEIMKLPDEDLVVVGGSSLGANDTPLVCSTVRPRKINFIFGCQPSLYGRKIQVPPNVEKALCMYAPLWAIWTLGYGSYKWSFISSATQQQWMTSFSHHPGDNDPRLHSRVLSEVSWLQSKDSAKHGP